MKKMQWISCCFSFLIFLQFNLSADNLIPLEHFFKKSEYDDLTISPDGKYLSVIAPVHGRRNLVLIEVANLNNARVLTQYQDFDLGVHEWASNDTIAFAMNQSGVQAEWSQYKVNTFGTPKVVELVGSVFGNSGIRHAGLYDGLPEDTDNVLMSFNRRRIASADLYKVPLDSRWSKKRKKNSKMKMIARNPGNVTSWATDSDGDVRGAWAQKGLEGQFYYKDKKDTEFTLISSYKYGEERIMPVSFGFDNKTMFVRSNIGRDKYALYEYDIETKKLGKMLFAHDEVDVRGVFTSAKNKKILGVTYFDETFKVFWLDEEEKKFRKAIYDNFPDKNVSFISKSKDENLIVVLVASDHDSGTYYLLNRQLKKMTYLFPKRALLKSEQLSTVKPFKFTSRDGLTIRGFITIPHGSSGKKMPAIIKGSVVLDVISNQFNPENQFFANRGYAAVEIISRGHTGYGQKFEEAVKGEFGGNLLDDYTDAVNYLINEGYLDPEKICVYGNDIGGYVAVSALIYQPDLYKCGISYNSTINFENRLNRLPKKYELMKETYWSYLGDRTDKELLYRLNLANHIDKIKAPMMIIHGSKAIFDAVQSANDLKDGLEKNGNKLTEDEWIVMNDEKGYRFQKDINKFTTYSKMEKFLAKHLQ